MTTTNIYSGAVEGKPTSRVLRPPGGGSSNIFGGCDEPAQPAQRNVKQYNRTDPGNLFGTGDPEPAQKSGAQGNSNRMASNVFGEAESKAPPPEPKEAENNEEEEEKKEEETEEKVDEETKNEETPKEEQNNNANGQQQSAPRRAGGNPLTGQGYTEPAPESQVHTSTRVRQPPGGASTKLW